VIYADLNTASPALKHELAALVADSGAQFADVALIGPVPARGLAQRQALVRSRTEAHEHYLNTRDAWLRTMKLASSGRPADLAALAIAQEAYEAAAAEWERWESGSRVAIAIDTEKDASVGAVVDQEIKWRALHDHDRSSGLIGRITKRLRGR
jgi:hypothetical protein